MIFFIFLFSCLSYFIEPTIGVKQGDNCDPQIDNYWIASPVDHQFFYCHNSTKKYSIAQCSIKSGQQKVFDAQKRQCVLPHPYNYSGRKGNRLVYDARQLETTRAATIRTPADLPQNFGTPGLLVDPPLIRPKQASAKNISHLQKSPHHTFRSLRPIPAANILNKSFEKKSQSMGSGTQAIGSVTAIGDLFGQSNRELKSSQKRRPHNICPGWRRPMLEPLSKNLVTCSLSSMIKTQDGQMDDDCQHRDFRCTFSSIEDKFGVCCQRLDYTSITCPPSTRPMTVEVDGIHRLKECLPSLYGSCQSRNAVCVFDLGDYHCCQDAYMISKDPDDSEEFVETSVVIYMTNASNKTLSSLKNQTKGPNSVRSRPKKVEKIEKHEAIHENMKCPDGSQPFKDPLSKAPAYECNITKGNDCPPGFHCHKSDTADSGLCCGITDVCGPNSGALVDPLTNTKIECNSEEGCPEPFYCNTSTSNCCSIDPVAGVCNHGISLLDENAKAVQCTEENKCPDGFSCVHRFKFSLCCPTKENICSQAMNTGLQCLASPPETAFYFNKYVGRCESFTYTGCSGNQRSDNRFEDEQQCKEMCQDTLTCPIGSPLVLPNKKTMKCSLEKKGSRKGQICPAGYLCLENSEGGVCCPIPETDVCASMHSEPYVASAQQYPMTCSIDSKNLRTPQKSHYKTCPTAFDCFQYKSFGIGFCCRIYYPQHHPTSTLAPPFVLDQIEACNNGDQPYKNAAGQVRRCSIQVEVEYGDDDETLEFETPPYCPKQYKCEFNSGSNRFQCCPDVSPISMKEKDYAVFEVTQSRPKESCPPGWVVALNFKTNEPIFCRKNAHEDCPSDSRCVYNSAYTRYVCCV